MLDRIAAIVFAATLVPAGGLESAAPQPILPDMPSAATPQTGDMAKPAFPSPEKKPAPPPPVVVKAAPAKAAPPVKQAPRTAAMNAPPKPSIKRKRPGKKPR